MVVICQRLCQGWGISDQEYLDRPLLSGDAGDALYDRRQTDISAHGIDHYSRHRPTSVGPILL
jgi:hypothetical protein